MPLRRRWARGRAGGRPAGCAEPWRAGTSVWRVLQGGDPNELLGDRRVALGSRQHPVDIGVDGADRERPGSLHLRQGEVGADSQLPGHLDRLRGGSEEPPGQPAVAAGQRVPQRLRLQRRNRHAQCVDRIRAAERVAEDQQPGREAADSVVASAKARRELVGDDAVARLGAADRGENIGRRDGLDEVEEALGVGRWVVSVIPDQCQDPPAVLLRQQHETGGPARLGADGDENLAAECVRRQPQVLAGVAQPDREPIFRRPVVATRRQPGRRPAAAPGRVDDEVRVEGDICIPGGPALDLHPGDAVPRRRHGQSESLALVDDVNRWERADTCTQVTLQVGPAELVDQRLRGPGPQAEEVTPGREAKLRPFAHHRRTPDLQVVEQRRKQFPDHPRARGHEVVCVPALRYPTPGFGHVGQRVAFHDRDPLVRIGHDSGREQPGNACAEHHGVVADLLHLPPPRHDRASTLEKAALGRFGETTHTPSRIMGGSLHRVSGSRDRMRTPPRRSATRPRAS